VIIDRAVILAALSNTNVKAVLRVLRAGESHQNDDAYTLLNGGGHFTDLSWHPYYGLPTPPAKAAGAYQYLGTTWKRYAEKYNVTAFSKEDQDFVAVADIAEHGALNAAIAGDLATVIRLLSKEWVSLPGLGTKARLVFENFGGRSDATAPPLTTTTAATTPQEKPVPLLLALLPAVLQLFAPRAQAALGKITGAAPDIVEKFASNVIDKVQQVTGKADPIEAVAELKKSPVSVVDQVEESALDHLDKLLPVLDKLATFDKDAWSAEEASRDAAAERGRADGFDLGPLLGKAAVALVAAILLAMFAIMGVQTWLLDEHEPTTAILTMASSLFGIVFSTAFGAIYGYRFGSSRSSSAKDVVLGEIASRAPRQT
jgi:muramidase (phage lysozyme)